MWDREYLANKEEYLKLFNDIMQKVNARLIKQALINMIKDDEEYFFCENDDCRFSYKYEWKRDEDSKLVTRDGTENYKFDNLIMLETLVKDGVETITELNQNKDE